MAAGDAGDGDSASALGDPSHGTAGGTANEFMRLALLQAVLIDQKLLPVCVELWHIFLSKSKILLIFRSAAIDLFGKHPESGIDDAGKARPVEHSADDIANACPSENNVYQKTQYPKQIAREKQRLAELIGTVSAAHKLHKPVVHKNTLHSSQNQLY